MGSNQANKVKVLCGACGAQLAVVRAFLDPYDPAAEPVDFTGTGWRDWFDADWGEGWRYQYDELNGGETSQGPACFVTQQTVVDRRSTVGRWSAPSAVATHKDTFPN